ncbi:leucine-rich repeat-containing G-protein coupled receptor 5 [Ostrinia furnacalis]|uniref:leucine-rich repeat-containing G-protein coupled receptor 5 n=1 Tax=Ostrinia furnacalis TaxID=93504 RepID=UPI001038B31F|nr:leucine-rich repeat-containing G-protein coupled receptor 5 [Ostrinia furnacalis]
MNFQRTVCLLLCAWAVAAEVLDFEDKSPNDLCYICSCNEGHTEIDCSRRGLRDLPGGLNAKVKKLNISNNEITTFPEGLSKLSNLIKLDISGNRLTELPKNGLSNLSALEELNLSRNYLENWITMSPNDFLVPAVHLKVLDLSYNRFKSMDNLAKIELLISSSLETLIMDHCEIESISGNSMLSGLGNIKVLKLNYNPLVTLQGLISPTLRSLYVNNCQLTSIEQNELSYLPSLIHLLMAHNYRLELADLHSTSLRFLDISYCNVLRPNLNGFPNLKKAIVNHNMIRFLRSYEFINNTKLEYLDLSYNNIGSIKVDTFRGLGLLKYLDLSWNEIGMIPEGALLEMPSLSQLKLARNYLNQVGHIKSTSLTTLDMSACEIHTIGKDSLEGLQSLIDLDLSRNLLSHIPDSISSNTLKYLNLNYNRLSMVNNFTFFMLPRLTGLAVVGNRFTNVWNKAYFDSNLYLERLDLSDNMWRCDCRDANMYDFFEFVTLEPFKKEESYNLVCSSPVNVIGQAWLEACYFIWYPTQNVANADSLIWFIVVMITGLALCILLVNCIRNSMKRRLRAIQAERERQVEEARDRLRQLRLRAEQESLINAPDPRDLIAPPSYDEALTMPKLNSSTHSLCDAGTGKTKKRRGRRKTKSSGDLLDETERNGDLPVFEDTELSETPDNNRRRRRRPPRRFGSHEIAELEHSPGARRRQVSEYEAGDDSVTIEIEAEMERPRNRRHSGGDEPRESNF